MPTNTSADLKDFGGAGDPVNTTPHTSGAAGYDDNAMAQNMIAQNRAAPGPAASVGASWPSHKSFETEKEERRR